MRRGIAVLTASLAATWIACSSDRPKSGFADATDAGDGVDASSSCGYRPNIVETVPYQPKTCEDAGAGEDAGDASDADAGTCVPGPVPGPLAACSAFCADRPTSTMSAGRLVSCRSLGIDLGVYTMECTYAPPPC